MGIIANGHDDYLLKNRFDLFQLRVGYLNCHVMVVLEAACEHRTEASFAQLLIDLEFVPGDKKVGDVLSTAELPHVDRWKHIEFLLNFFD